MSGDWGELRPANRKGRAGIKTNIGHFYVQLYDNKENPQQHRCGIFVETDV